MLSGVENEFDSSSLKKKLFFMIKGNNLTNLRALGQKLKTIQRDAFRIKYENLLSLLEVEVQISTITALAQYYDPPLRCFTFQDFQLLPTIEEFEQILHLPMEGKIPYIYLEQHSSIPTLAEILKIHPKELESRLVERKNTRGFPQKFIENYLYRLAGKEDWGTFMDVLALTIYGIMLFPNLQHFVKYAAINVFVAMKNRSENLVTSILADIYETLDSCYKMKQKKVSCCLPALYVWLTSRVSDKVINIKCPVKEVLQHGPEMKISNDWSQFFAGLIERKIKWQPSWQQRSLIIYHCGNYSNVSLIGTRGRINYNSVLAQRQFGYPIKGSQTPDALTTLLISYEDWGVT